MSIPGGLVQVLTDVTRDELKHVLADPVAMKVSQLAIAYLLEMYLRREHYDIHGEELRSPQAILHALARDGQIIVIRR
ncbi:hypothetical protein ES705_03347 [subsurface metagenome]